MQGGKGHGRAGGAVRGLVGPSANTTRTTAAGAVATVSCVTARPVPMTSSRTPAARAASIAWATLMPRKSGPAAGAGVSEIGSGAGAVAGSAAGARAGAGCAAAAPCPCSSAAAIGLPGTPR